MNILLLDIETAPNLAYVWGLWQQNIAINQIEASSHVLCWSAKWFGQDRVHFDSIKKSDRMKMLSRIHTMLDRADAVVHYNGKKFDIPTLNKEFVINGFSPPSPYKQIDLLQVCRRAFRFESNKLDYVTQSLGIGQKVRHEGHDLWVKCMKLDREAWKRMEEYNRHDVVLLERLYVQLRPWIQSHPNLGTFEDYPCCTNCGSDSVHRRGYAVTRVMKYPRFQCRDCGTWFRGNKSVSSHRGEKYVPIVG